MDMVSWPEEDKKRGDVLASPPLNCTIRISNLLLRETHKFEVWVLARGTEVAIEYLLRPETDHLLQAGEYLRGQ